MRKLALFTTSCFILLLSFLVLSPKNTFAQGEFETDYKVQYEVDNTGKTRVTQNITLKNKTANFYAEALSLKIGSTKVEDIKASDATGPLEASAKFENNITTITVKFSQRVIGLEKSLPFTVSYSTKELATKSGQIWEVSIPRLVKSQDIGIYDAAVVVPSSFGGIAFALPNPKDSKQAGTKQEFAFDKEQLTASGIAISFGQKQIFSFSLDYHLKNEGFTPRFETVALPPDNNYQKIVLENLEPKPLDVIVDADNNFIAKYKLGPKQEVKVTASGYVEVFSKPFRNIYKPLTPAEKELYTQPQKYWETNSPFIGQKADELKTPKAIYDFVTDYLSYSEERLAQPKVERRGAQGAADAPTEAICMEFTDLFIAIARAAKIPAREIQGYAYTQNERLRPLSLTYTGDILHAWPEYWDDQIGWVQIDPTWGSTSGGLDYFNKLDFNHIAFVHRGAASTSPFPAGSYKKDNDYSKKDVFVQFAQDLPNQTYAPSLALFVPEKILSGFPVKIRAQIQNTGTTSIINGTARLTSTNLKNVLRIDYPQTANSEENTITIPILPPYSNRTFNFSLAGKGLLSSSKDTIVLSFGENKIQSNVSILPIYSAVFLRSFLISAASAAAFIGLGLYFYRKSLKKKRPKAPPPKV